MQSYQVISRLENDAPSSLIQYYTISFLTPKFESTKQIDIHGFCVYEGYIHETDGKESAKRIKDQIKYHDVFLAEIGKVYAWDDVTKSNQVCYDDEKLNDMEARRRENVDRARLLNEQHENENKKTNAKITRRQKLQQDLYKRGQIYLDKSEKTPSYSAELTAQFDADSDTYTDEYLNTYSSNGFRFGAITFYSPDHIRGLNTFCYKVRGLYTTQKKMMKHAQELAELYPHDSIYSFEMGKWCPYMSYPIENTARVCKRLNHLMKIYLEQLEADREKFDARRKEIETLQENGPVPYKEENNESDKVPEAGIERMQIGTLQDQQHIRAIYEYLHEPELHGKFRVNESELKTHTIEV